jgi:hypothetical protein
MTYRQISIIAKCSSGAVSAEIKQMKKEAKILEANTIAAEIKPEEEKIAVELDFGEESK